VRILSPKDYPSVNKDNSIAQVLKLLAEAEVQFAIVLDNDRLIGVFSGGDLIRGLAENFDYQSFMSSRIADYCNESPLQVATTEISVDTVERFKKLRIQYIPVVNESGIYETLIEAYP